MPHQQNLYDYYLSIVLKNREILKSFSTLKDIEEAMSYLDELRNSNYDFYQMKSKTTSFIKRLREDLTTNFIDIVRLNLTNNNNRISLDEMQENYLSASLWFEIETLAIKGIYELIKIKSGKPNANYEEIIGNLIQGNFRGYFPFAGF